MDPKSSYLRWTLMGRHALLVCRANWSTQPLFFTQDSVGLCGRLWAGARQLSLEQRRWAVQGPVSPSRLQARTIYLAFRTWTASTYQCQTLRGEHSLSSIELCPLMRKTLMCELMRVAGRGDEIVAALALSTGGRPLARIGAGPVLTQSTS